MSNEGPQVSFSAVSEVIERHMLEFEYAFPSNQLYCFCLLYSVLCLKFSSLLLACCARFSFWLELIDLYTSEWNMISFCHVRYQAVAYIEASAFIYQDGKVRLL